MKHSLNKDPETGLYPPISEFKSEFLEVGEGHTLYVEQSGNPDGIPLVFLHGGPGGGSSPDHRRFYNPEKYRIVCFDQRGCGKSKPFASLEANTTWHLVSDIEKIRNHLKIDRWVVSGGSWGSTLALAYSQSHPNSCLALVLRGVFLTRKWEIEWFYQEGASRLFPDAWENYLKPIPVTERNDLVKAYHKRLTSTDLAVQKEAAKAWTVWEGATSKLIPDPKMVGSMEEDEFAIPFARIENHYFVNNTFFENDEFLLNGCAKIKHLPTLIVQGRYDVVCPPKSAWDLYKKLPDAEFVMVPDSGHSMFEHGISKVIVSYTDKLKVN